MSIKTATPSLLAGLPIVSALPELATALARHRNVVLQAPPGAGKSTGVPLSLLEAPWLRGRRILLLEPRRLAARAVAMRMAAMLGEAVGERVGYRMRMDSRVGKSTRIEVVTEGVLTRRLQHDPALEGVGGVIFDEFHERSLQADLGLALCLDMQATLREDLRLLVMSATLDGAAVARLLDGAPIITAAGRSFPVDTRHVTRSPEGRIEREVTATVLRALRAGDGDLLVFLPGVAEIRRVQKLLEEAGPGGDIHIVPLYGDLPQEQQDLALRPSPDAMRKIVLATSIAETSLTIEGVRIVVDAGLMRRQRFDPGGGMSRLATTRVSRASADQRRGRAGRLGPGVCHRLWTEGEHAGLLPYTPPEILETDLAPLALELACWGVADASLLRWLDPPPAAALAQARDLLTRLGALDARGRVTAHGREMAELGLHPRLAHMILRARPLGLTGLACEIAALLGERDILRNRPGQADADLRLRIELLHDARGSAGHRHEVDRAARQRVLRTVLHWQRQLHPSAGATTTDRVTEGSERAGLLLAFAYPDRIARRRGDGRGRYLLSNGRGAFFAEPQGLAGENFLVIPELDGREREARIFLAAPVRCDELEEHFADLFQDIERVVWDSRGQAVVARRERRLGELTVAEQPLVTPDRDRLVEAMLDGVRELGVRALPWDRATRTWQARVRFLRRLSVPGAESWPDLSDAHLTATLGVWLGPWLNGVTRREHLDRIDLAPALRALLTWEQARALDELAPTHLTVPSGSRIPIDYLGEETPALAVRLQEMFGLGATPTIGGGRVPLMIKLLSPAGRPVQVTRDLESFWARGYHEVKRELKGRYPKHYWPDDPHQAQPTRRTRRRIQHPGGER